MNAIDRMKEEHRVIEAVLERLEVFCERLEDGGEAAPEDGAAMVEFFQRYADRFHHDKEERLIFPLLERLGVPKAGGPVEIMLEDHEQGRGCIKRLAESLERLANGDREAVPALAAAARDYISLLREHIRTEDDAIFDMAEMRLSARELDQLAAEFDTVEKVMFGPQEKESFEGLAERLKDKLDR